MKKLKINKKYTVNRDVMSQSGMLYSGATVKILEIKDDKLMIEDAVGRLFYIKDGDITN